MQIDFSNNFAGSQPVSKHMFGEILLDTQPHVQGGSTTSVAYGPHFQEAYNTLGMNLLRYPDGELPDGFASYDSSAGTWSFVHNTFNKTVNTLDFPKNEAGQTPALNQNGKIDNNFLDDLKELPALSLKYDDLLHEGLKSEGRVGFEASLKEAVKTGSAFSLVLPEFQYYKAPASSPASTFSVNDHVHFDDLKDDITKFLDDLFNKNKFNNGNLPEKFILEIGNESYFGWNENLVESSELPAAGTKDFDSHSAYAIGVLEAVKDFRASNPNANFDVALQASGYDWVEEMLDNLDDAGKRDLLAEVDIVSAAHPEATVLHAEQDAVRNIEDGWWVTDATSHITTKISDEKIKLDQAAGVDLFLSAWGARGDDWHKDNNPRSVKGAAATLSQFSALFELGFDYAANWGIGAWPGYGTNASASINSEIEYAPYIEAYRMLAESVPGMRQLNTADMDNGESSAFSAYAFSDDAKGVIFVASHGGSISESVSLEDFGSFSQAWVEILKNDGTIARSSVSFTANSYTVSLAANEVARIVVNRQNPANDGVFLWDDSASSTLDGTNGDDRIHSGAGNDTLSGLLGNDTLKGEAGNDLLYGGVDDDRLEGGEGDDTLRGYDGEDRLFGGEGDDSLEGQDGNDTLSSGKGTDVVFGGAGDDYVIVGGGYETFDGGSGTDFIDYVNSANGVNINLATNTVDKSWAVNDTITGFESAAGSLTGSDTISGTSGANAIHGNGGNDSLKGLEGNDTLFGGSGNDSLYSGVGTDVVFGGAGDDYIRVGGGIENFDGGSGKDYISYYDATGNITINLDTDSISGQGSWAVNDTIKNFESYGGSNTGNDHVTGTSGDNTIRTYGGNDSVYGGSGNDIVELGAGNDYVRVGGGAENFDGGSGSDYISYYDSSNGITIDLDANTVSGSWAVNDTIKDFESASGSKTGADTMYGTSGANKFRGYGGNDKLYGRSGDDTLYGGDGGDRFDGGAGTDLLYGEAGADIFHFDFGEDHDIIKDFENNVDTIELDNFTFASGQDAFDFASQIGSDVVFDFGGGDKLTVENATIAQLHNDLVMV